MVFLAVEPVRANDFCSVRKGIEIFVVGHEGTSDHDCLVYVKSPDDDGRLCTGVRLARGVVITAAHCIVPGFGAVIGFGSSTSTGVKVAVRPDSVIFMQEHKPGSITPGYDLALLRFSEPKSVRAQFASVLGLQEAMVAMKQTESLRVVGYGVNSNGQSGIQSFAHVAILDETCTYLPQIAGGCVGMKEFVLSDRWNSRKDPKKASDTCQGDSGGPAFLIDAVTGELVLIGVTSRGYSETKGSAAGCGQGGIYTHLGRASVLKWLRQHAPGIREAGAVNPCPIVVQNTKHPLCPHYQTQPTASYPFGNSSPISR